MSYQEIVFYCVITETLSIWNDKFRTGTFRAKISVTLINSDNPHNLSP
jgi:hypothetical protein